MKSNSVITSSRVTASLSESKKATGVGGVWDVRRSAPSGNAAHFLFMLASEPDWLLPNPNRSVLSLLLTACFLVSLFSPLRLLFILVFFAVSFTQYPCFHLLYAFSSSSSYSFLCCCCCCCRLLPDRTNNKKDENVKNNKSEEVLFGWNKINRLFFLNIFCSVKTLAVFFIFYFPIFFSKCNSNTYYGGSDKQCYIDRSSGLAVSS